MSKNGHDPVLEVQFSPRRALCRIEREVWHLDRRVSEVFSQRLSPADTTAADKGDDNESRPQGRGNSKKRGEHGKKRIGRYHDMFVHCSVEMPTTSAVMVDLDAVTGTNGRCAASRRRWRNEIR